MCIATTKQNFLDWITQQWVIVSGKKINSKEDKWLLGPFGNTNGVGEKFINQLAENENLEICNAELKSGLIQSIDQLNLPSKELNRLSKNVIDFYENTSNYQFNLKTKWNPFFKPFGYLLKSLFSNRIEQLNIPINNKQNAEGVNSRIIQLIDKKTKNRKRTVWLRALKKSKQIVYSGVYETCKLPNGTACIKAIFPLPNGNATVILQPSVGDNGALILRSSGKKIGDSGFYFLLKDNSGSLWTKYVKSFKDSLTVSCKNGQLNANQQLTFYGLNVLNFEYEIIKTGPHQCVTTP